MMRTKRLGRSELQLPIVGIGTAFTGIPTQNQTVRQYEGAPSAADRELGVETLVAAIDAGCRFFDTAVLYGNSVSETMIGEALRQRPAVKDEMIITTKAGRTHEFYDFSFDFILRSVNDSLERMGLDSVDIVYVMMPWTSRWKLYCRLTAPGALRTCRSRDCCATLARPPTIRRQTCNTSERVNSTPQ